MIDINWNNVPYQYFLLYLYFWIEREHDEAILEMNRRMLEQARLQRE